MKKLKEKEINPISPNLTDEEMEYRDKLILQMSKAKDLRDSSYKEFDDQTYSTYYDRNAEAANSYLRPKTNKEDTRIVTGTTREKEMTLLSALLNYNFQPEIMAYDTNNLLVDQLGKEMGDLVIKSRELESYETKRELIYKEMLDQGSVFVEECWVEPNKVVKEIPQNMEIEKLNPSKKINWKERLEKSYGQAEVRLIEGTKVFLGNIKEFCMYKQPYVFTVETISYSEAESIYGDWERWQYVPKKVVKSASTNEIGSEYSDWTLLETEADMVEVIKYQNKWDNEIQIMLNGIVMLPAGFPLTSISPSGEYTIAKGDVEPISKFFAYSKSYPAKTKVDQEVLDEFLRLMILKTQQSFMPPLANNTNRAISRNVFMAGKITPNINPDKLKPIIEATGVTQPEFAMFELIKKLVDEKTANPVFAGEGMPSDTTATQIRAMQRQQLMKLGLVTLGVIELEKQLTWLRIQNIVDKWTGKIDQRVDKITGAMKDIYQSFSMNTTNEMGQDILKITEFNPEYANLGSEQIEAEENLLEKNTYKKPVRITYLNPELLKTAKLSWYVNIVPTEKNTNDLKAVLFSNSLKNAIALFGMQTLNMPYIMKRYAFLNGENPDMFFNKMPMQPQMMGMMGQGQGGQGASIVANQNPATEALNNLNSVESGLNPTYSEPQLMNQLMNG